jgi:hypothetical protein
VGARALVLLCQASDLPCPGPGFGALYIGAVSPMLRLDAGQDLLGCVAPTDSLGRSVQGVFRPSRPRDQFEVLRRRTAQRQRPEVNAGDARPVDGPDSLSSLPALCYACSLECYGRMASIAGRFAGTQRRVDLRRYGVSQTRSKIGWGGAAVFGDAGQDRELPGGRHGCAVEWSPRLVRGHGVVSVRGVAFSRATCRSSYPCATPVSREVALGTAAASDVLEPAVSNSKPWLPMQPTEM